MLKLQFPDRPREMVFCADGRRAAVVKPTPDGAWTLTNVGAGHTIKVASPEIGIARAKSIVTMLLAGSPR